MRCHVLMTTGWQVLCAEYIISLSPETALTGLVKLLWEQVSVSTWISGPAVPPARPVENHKSSAEP